MTITKENSMTKMLDNTNKTEVFATVFVAAGEINKMMNCLDLADSGTKMFGAFKDLTFTTTTKVDDQYKQDMVRHMILSDDIGYAEIGDYFAFNPKLHSLSLGARFIWVKDYREQLLAAGMKEVEI